MRVLVKLVIAGLVLHGCWRAGTAYWKHYQFVDEVQATAQFGGKQAEHALHGRVLELAARLDIPLDPERLGIRRELNHTYITADYVRRVEILPRYFYPWNFSVNVNAFTLEMPAELAPGGRP
jgi:hypothetical protein